MQDHNTRKQRAANQQPGDEPTAVPGRVQAKLAPAQDATGRPAPALDGPGQALPSAVKAKMERAFGTDFSGVKIHEGGSATAIGALAYAQGDHIHFAPGQYDPSSGRGQELLGHELAHVVQQRQGRASAQHTGITADPALEAEADAAGALAARGQRVEGPAYAGPTAAAPGAVVQTKFVSAPSDQGVIWIDDADEAKVPYRELAASGTARLLESTTDGRHIFIDVTTGERIVDPEQLATLSEDLTERHPRGFFGRDPILDVDEEAEDVAIAKAKQVQKDKLTAWKDEEKRKREEKSAGKKKRSRRKNEYREKKKPKLPSFPLEVEHEKTERREQAEVAEVSKLSPFTASVALRPIAPGVVSDGRRRYAASELTVDNVAVSNMDRGDTKFGVSQMSHTVAWTLLRRGLAGFAGRPFTELHEFLERGANELTNDEQDGAKDLAKGMMAPHEDFLSDLVWDASKKPAESNTAAPEAPQQTPTNDELPDAGPVVQTTDELPEAEPLVEAPTDELPQAEPFVEAPTDELPQAETLVEAPTTDELPDAEPLVQANDELPDAPVVVHAHTNEDAMTDIPALAPAHEDLETEAIEPNRAVQDESAMHDATDNGVAAIVTDEEARDDAWLWQVLPKSAQAPETTSKPAATPEKKVQRAPLETWISLATRLTRAYVMAYQKSQSATYNKKAKGRSEATHMARLTQAEQALAEHGVVDAADVATAAIGLLDVNLTIDSVDYWVAVHHWFELLSLAFPNVIEAHGPTIWAKTFAAVTPAWKRNTGHESMAEFLGEQPKHGYSKATPAKGSEIGRFTGLTSNVSLSPAKDAQAIPTDDKVEEEMYTLDQLEIDDMQLGEERPPTRYRTKQRSHTTAWTLARASMLSFVRRPLADLHDYLRHTIEHLIDDLPSHIEDHARVRALQGARTEEDEELAALDEAPDEQAPAKELSEEERLAAIAADAEAETTETTEESFSQRATAERLLATVRELPARRTTTLSAWYRLMSELVVETMRLYQLSTSATYSTGEEKPAGHAEADSMATLRRSEQHLINHGYLAHPKGDIIDKAVKLLDVAFGNPTLTWKSYARAVIHWQECLWNAFPNIMRAGAPQITAKVLDVAIPKGTWPEEELPKGATTVRHLVQDELTTRASTRPLAEERVNVGGPFKTLLSRRPGGRGDGALQAFGLGLMGAIGQGSIDREHAAEILARAGMPHSRFLSLCGLHSHAAGARAIQDALFPVLRRIAVDLVRAREDVRAAIVAELAAEVVARANGNTDASTRAAALAEEIAGAAKRFDVATKDAGEHRAAQLEGSAGEWAQRAGLPRYLECLDGEGTHVGNAELEALAVTFGVRLVRVVGETDAPAMHAMPESPAPILGMRQRKGKWSAMTTERGTFDLSSDKEGDDPLAAWGSGGFVTDEVPLLAEGTFLSRGERRIVWNTVGDDNCAFNGLSLVVVGLIAQGRLAAAPVAERLEMTETDLGSLVALAPVAQTITDVAWQIQTALTGRLRKLAVAALPQEEGTVNNMFAELCQQVGAKVRTALGHPADVPASDLFGQRSPFASGLQPVIESIVARIRETPAFTAPAPAEADAMAHWAATQRAAIDACLNETTDTLRRWFTSDGLDMYCKHMATDRVWAGGPELHAVAHALGFDLMTYRDVGSMVYPVDDMPPDGERPVAAMFRHNQRSHWSAVSTDRGSYDMRDGTDRLGNQPAPVGRVDEEGSFQLEPGIDLVMKSEVTSHPAPKTEKPVTSQAKVTFQRVAKTVGTTAVDYADHMFERTNMTDVSKGPFSRAKVDPSGTLTDTDKLAVVNAANSTLIGSSGIALAIQDATGTPWASGQLDEGDAVATGSGKLDRKDGAQNVIHTVGPHTSNPKWKQLLNDCCRRVLEEAAKAQIDGVVFCVISGKIFNDAKLPEEEIAQEIVTGVEHYLAHPTWGAHVFKSIVFNNFPGKP